MKSGNRFQNQNHSYADSGLLKSIIVQSMKHSFPLAKFMNSFFDNFSVAAVVLEENRYFATYVFNDSTFSRTFRTSSRIDIVLYVHKGQMAEDRRYSLFMLIILFLLRTSPILTFFFSRFIWFHFGSILISEKAINGFAS